MKFSFLFAALLLSVKTFAQDDLLSLVADSSKPGNEKVIATFKTTKIISAQSIETVKAKTLDFRITHRFGNAGTESNGGAHTLWGWDNSNDIRFSFDYGITDRIAVGVARNKMNELLDGSVKWRFLEQTKNNKMPLSVVLYSNMGITPQKEDQFYLGTINVAKKFAHRISYTDQLVIARKFNSWFSFEAVTSYTHRNFVKNYINPDNNAVDENDIFSVGAGGRIKLTKRFSIMADYFYIISDYRAKNSSTPYYNPLSIGCEIETGGHVFHINFSNASGINENNFIPNTTDTWTKGGYKFGFNISRVFNL